MTIDGEVTGEEGLIAGVEYLAYGSRGKGRENVTLMVQIPDGFDPEQPCIVTGPSSGSRGVYGAIAMSGEWGLKRGCAVAYTDKGTGNGIPPTGGIELINDESPDGPLLDRRSVSPSTGRTDENLDGALCLRALATGADDRSGNPSARDRRSPAPEDEITFDGSELFIPE